MAMSWLMQVACSVLLMKAVVVETNSTSNGEGSISAAVSSTSKTTAVYNEKCEFFLTDSTLHDRLSETLGSKVNMIKFNVKFKGYPDDILIAKGGDLFRPNLWIRSTSRQGQSLLMLDDNFEMLSLSLLGIGVVLMDVELHEKPQGCMNHLTPKERENSTRYMVFNDFKLPGPGEKSGSLSKKERICNMRIVPENDKANFVYHCCHIDPDGNEICEDVHRDLWINVLLICIIIIKVMVVLYSPTFVPETFYRKKFTATEYVHHIPPDKKKKKLKIVKTMYPGSYTSENPPIRLEKIEGLEYMKLSLNSLQVDKIYDVKLDRIQLLVKARKLLSETYVPVSVTKMIYENIFRCKMRNLPSLKPCCDTGICGVIDVGCKVLTWFRCLRIFAKLILIGLLAIPWIIRLVMYFTYEAAIVEEKNEAAERFQAGMHFHGSFTLYLTPLHGLFVAIYIIVSIDSFAYGLLGTAMKNRFKFILRKCLRDMRERSRSSAYGWAVALALLPFKRFGLIGFLLVPIYWILLLPIMVPILAFYTFPALNLSIRLIIHLFLFMCPNRVLDHFNKMSENMSSVKNNLNLKDIGEEEEFQGKENMSKKEVCIQLCIIIMCLTSFWSLTFLLMECLSFFVEVGVYTLMGIIVNAGATLQYVTVIFLIGMYAKNAFSGVHSKYLDYHKIIRGQLLSRKREEMKQTARQDSMIQENTVFRVQSSYNAADKTSGIGIEVKDGNLRWTTEGLLVFLSSMDQPFTPEKFFFETINMNYCGCPGKLWQNTLYAFYNFMKIMVFLFFVVIVVLAFGNQFSTTNQMLATLAGGFVPFVFRNFFMKGAGSFTVDTGSIQFVTEFESTIARFTQKWSVSDIIPASITEAGVPLELAEEVKPGDDGGREEESEIVHPDNNNAENKDSSPLIESNETKDIRLDVDSDDSEFDETKVDLIIDIARFDKLNRRIGIEGSLVNVGSLSMLADGNASIYRTPQHTNTFVV
ncbi:uncharacterized protein LOC124146152 [Haliotis rufescens]|uniref:uncharacterized protein LOC124146152 n=1 Tax=Haliotis rufescens TaxID=6454 RepID=UPI00201F259B|nr:uncharacterized protein LOC124146152 [Haliotis rufescens]